MAWIIVVKGACISVRSNDPYELKDEIQGLDEFKRLTEASDKHGLMCTLGSDSDNRLMNLILGAELHQNRYISQGETITLDDSLALPEDFDDLCNQALAMVMSLDPSATIKTGVVIYNFD